MSARLPPLQGWSLQGLPRSVLEAQKSLAPKEGARHAGKHQGQPAHHHR